MAAPTSTAWITELLSDSTGLLVPIPAGGRSNDATPVLQGSLSGSLLAGERVQVFNGTALIGTATVDPVTNTWSLSPTLPATAGKLYSFTVVVVNGLGQRGAVSAARSVTLDTTAPIAPKLTLFQDTGVSSTDRITANGRVTVTGLEAGAPWQYSNDGGLSWLSGTGNYFIVSGDGARSVIARQTDGAGNSSALAAPLAFSLDTLAPAALASISGIEADLSGTPIPLAPGARTADTTPLLRGRVSLPLAPGEQVQVLNGATVLGTASLDPLTNLWSFPATLPASPGTTYAFKARVIDAAGNGSTPSAAYNLTVDTVAPTTVATIVDVTDNQGYVTGSVPLGGSTDDDTPTLTGTVSAAPGASEVVRVYNGATLLGSAAVNRTTLAWSYTPSLPASATGTPYSLTARVEDGAGLQGPSSAPRPFTLKTSGDWSYDWSTATPLGTTPGLLRTRVTLNSPRPLSVSALRVDLSTPGLRLTGSGPMSPWVDGVQETLSLTTRQTIQASQTTSTPWLGGINGAVFSLLPGNDYRSVPTNLMGLVVSDSKLVSSPVVPGGPNGVTASPTFWLDSITGAHFQTVTSQTVLDPSTITMAVSGFGLVLQNGLVRGDRVIQNARTGLGMSSDGRYVVLMTVDRQIDPTKPLLPSPTYIGATDWDVGQLLQGFGASHGLNLDGGGSTQMAWWNSASQQTELLNSPLAERSVGHSIGVVYQPPI